MKKACFWIAVYLTMMFLTENIIHEIRDEYLEPAIAEMPKGSQSEETES